MAGINMINIDAGKVDKASATVVKQLKNIQGLAKFASRKSIMTMAAPAMYNYPLIMSSSIPTDEAMSLAKGFQMTYAASVATAYSLNGIMDREETPQLSDFVQKFHQNDPNLLTANIQGAANKLGVQESYTSIPEGSEITVESATVVEIPSKLDALALSMAAMDNVEDGLVMESLNDMYKPYDRTRKILEDKISQIREAKLSGATEGVKDIFDADSGVLAKVNQAVTDKEYDSNGREKGVTGITPGSTKRTKKDPKTGKTIEIIEDKKSPVIRNFKNEVVRNSQLEAMEPTMVNVQIVAHGKSDANGGNGQSVHNITLCVKAVPRLIGSNLMIASMVEACQESHAIFKFLKWTKGEIKTLDYVLGISASKKKALEKNAKNEVKFLEQQKKRKRINSVGKFVKNEVLPTTTIVITTYEAAKIKEACGVDLHDVTQAIKLMNKYYLLSFGIYDTEQNTMKVMFDCDTDWGYTTIGSLASALKKTNDMFNQNDVLRIFGRR